MDSLITKNLHLHPDDEAKFQPECGTTKYGKIFCESTKFQTQS